MGGTVRRFSRRRKPGGPLTNYSAFLGDIRDLIARGHATVSIVQLGLLFAIATPFALAAWIAHRRKPEVLLSADATPDSTAGSPLACAGFAAETLDIEPVVRVVADALSQLARTHTVHIELAVTPGLQAHIDPNALRLALRAAIFTAIRATPGGQVLVTGATVGGQSHIRVTDDGKDANQLTRESLARDAEELIALQGGSIAVDVTTGRGTTVTLRLPPPGVSDGVLDQSPALVRQAA